MTDIYKWSKTAADNDDADSGINWAEFQDPDTVNNSARTMMKRVADWRDDTMPTRTSAGTGNSYTVTANAAPASFSSDFVVWFKADKSNTGSATLIVNALSAKPLRAKSGAALTSGDIQAGTIIGAYYSVASDEFLIINSGYHFTALSSTIASSFAVGLKVGMKVDWFGSALPAGFLWADGSAVSRATYAELFAAYGTAYGAGDGSTTFNLPDLRGRSTFGRDDMGGTAVSRLTAAKSGIAGATLGATGGAESVTIARSDLPNVTLSLTGQTASGGSHSHSVGNQGSVNREAGGSGSAGPGTDNTSTAGAHSHSLTGDTESLNGNVTQTELRNVPPAIVCNVIILALPAAANAAALGTNGLPYKFSSTTTAGDPGGGYVRLNHATPSSASAAYVSVTGANSEALGDFLATFDDSTSATRGHLHLYQIGAVSNFAIYAITGAAVDNTTYRTLTLTHVASSGTFTDQANISALFYRSGDKGDAGPSGGGLPWRWDTATADADPGSGDIRANNATLASATELYISTTDSSSASQTAWLDSLDDSTSTIKGVLQVTKTDAPSNFVLFNVTAVTTATGYRKLTVAHVTSGGSFAASDGVTLIFSRSGDAGSAGASGTSSGIPFNFDSSTTTAADPGTAEFRLNNATLSSVTEISVSYSSAETGNPSVSDLVKSWDDSTSTPVRGTLILKRRSAPQNFASYHITSAITDGTTYGRYTLSHVASAGSFSASDAVSFEFYRAGDPGTGGGLSDIVLDVTPQLGGQLDVNGHALGDGTLELLSFTETASAVNQINITNAATGTGPIVGVAGNDTNVDLRLTAKGTGVVNVTSTLKTDGTIELGHASDTTLSRVSAGLVAVEGNTVCLLGTAQEFTRTHNFDMTTLTDGASVSWDLSQNQVAQLTLGGNRSLSAPTNQVAGATYILIVKQDGTGSRTLSWDTTYKFPSGTDPTLSTAAGAIDVVTFVSDGTNMLGVCQKAFA